MTIAPHTDAALAAARQTIIAKSRQVGPVRIEPITLATLWLFEALNHPFYSGSNAKPGVKLSMRDTALAIYIFNDTEAACRALPLGLEHVEKQARKLLGGIDPGYLPEISAAITAAFKEGYGATDQGHSTTPVS